MHVRTRLTSSLASAAAGLALLTASAVADPPRIITAPPEFANASPTVTWAATDGAERFEWRVLQDQAPAAGPETLTATSVTLPPLADGGYVFQVRSLSADGDGDPWQQAASARFTIDTVAPRLIADALRPPPGASGVPTQVDVAITVDEPFAPPSVSTVRLCTPLCATVVPTLLAVPAETSLNLSPQRPLEEGTTYEVDVTGLRDRAGNGLAPVPATWRFTTARRPAPPTPPAPSPAAPPAVPPSLVAATPPRTYRPHLLRPGVDVGVPRRPLLRWPRPKRKVTLYNVQIETTTGRRVVTAFTRRPFYRPPARRLHVGQTYVWRVWTYRAATGYPRMPLAQSYFRVTRR